MKRLARDDADKPWNVHHQTFQTFHASYCPYADLMFQPRTTSRR